jgi:hypothetical protein
MQCKNPCTRYIHHAFTHRLHWSLKPSVKWTWTGSTFSTNESTWSVMVMGTQSRVWSGPQYMATNKYYEIRSRVPIGVWHGMEYNMHGCLAFAAWCSRSQPRSRCCTLAPAVGVYARHRLLWNTICTVAWLSRHGARGRNLALAVVPLHPRLVSTPVIVDGWLPEQPTHGWWVRPSSLTGGLWEPTNTKSSGLAGFCAKSGYFRVTCVSSRDSVKCRR